MSVAPRADGALRLERGAVLAARRVVGLAPTYDHDSFGFGNHASAEGAIDGRWVAVDPTWNETLADATHIPLLVGDGDEWGAAAALLPRAKAGASYAFTFKTPDGVAPYAWRLVKGDLPPGLTLSASGALGGKPTSPRKQAYEFVIEVTDASDPPRTGSQRFMIAVDAAPLRIVVPGQPLRIDTGAGGGDTGQPDTARATSALCSKRK